jgi:hypothetical protein
MAHITLPARGIIRVCDIFFWNLVFFYIFIVVSLRFFFYKLLVTYVTLPNSLILPS